MMNATLLLNAFLAGMAMLRAGFLTPQQQNGREIYRRGTVAGAVAGTVAIGADAMSMPSTAFACANCHGVWGEGSREGGIDVPTLHWKRLTSPAVSTVTGRRRAPYTAETLRTAIARGLDPAGMRLHPGMPRYGLSAERLAAVAAYLERIGDVDDTDPGVTATTIRIGAALPLSGPQADAGASIRDTLQLTFGAASGGGGIYGRSIELVARDSAMGLRQATRQLIEQDGVFALVGSFIPAGPDDTGQMLQSLGVPLIGPVTVSPHQEESPNPYVFYLLPTLYDQARALVDFVVTRDAPRRPKLAMILSGTALDDDVRNGLRRQASLHALPSPIEERESLAAAILSKQPDYLIFSGGGSGLAQLARQLDGSPSTSLAAFVTTAQSGITLLPQSVAAKALLAAPGFPPDTTQAKGFFAVLEAAHSPRTFLGLRMAAYTAGSVLVEALRSSGSRLSRDGLVRTLEHIQNLETGITAPLTFGPSRRVGSVGAVILSFDPMSRTFVSTGGWLTPKE